MGASVLQTKLPPINLKVNIIPLVLILRFCWHPPTVFGTIIAIVVDSIKRASIWPWSHVIAEGRIAVAPSLADPDPPAAPPWVVSVAGIVASALHGAPDVINLVGLRRVFNAKAGLAAVAAARGLLLKQIAFCRPRKIPARALHDPVPLSEACHGREPDNRPLAHDQAVQRYAGAHQSVPCRLVTPRVPHHAGALK